MRLRITAVSIVLAALLPGAHATWGAEPNRAADRRPNIIFIMADDMARDWVGCYGAAHHTPNLDRLAADGVKFETVWCNPICTPTRLELLTGMYAFRTGWVRHHDVPRWGGLGFDWDRFTSFARVVEQSGYATAIGGKWQINDFRKYPDALKKHGFDEHCVWTGYETGNPPSFKRYWDGYLQTNGKRAVHEYGPDAINDFLIDFIRRHKDGPFLVYYPMMLTHGPHTPTPLSKDAGAAKKGGAYGAQVTYVDHLVGRMVDAVDELGIAHNTVIFFTGDNGSSAAGSLHGATTPKSKGKTTDLGVHVPLIVRAPMLGTGGRTCDDLVDFTDLLPTFAELAGAPLPEGVTLDGRSIVASIAGKRAAQTKRRWIYAQGGQRIVRDGRFKLDGSGAFWDLAADPLEQDDLRESSDAEVAAARARLAEVLAAMPQDGPPPFEGYRGASARVKPKKDKPKSRRRSRGNESGIDR